MAIIPDDYEKIVFFTGAGMPAESGIPTYRGKGGIWDQYNWEEYACQRAFKKDPEKVLKFHELRRKAVLNCHPHSGHLIISMLEAKHSNITIITQNIDGMHQRAGSKNVYELHGSLWRVNCPHHGNSEDIGETYHNYKCPECGCWLRPDIVWFEDMLEKEVMQNAINAISECNLFFSIGTSGVVYPAAGFPPIAKENNAYCIEINPEISSISQIYDLRMKDLASNALSQLFPGVID